MDNTICFPSPSPILTTDGARVEPQARAARERQAAARRRKHAQRMLRAKYFQAKSEIAEQVSTNSPPTPPPAPLGWVADTGSDPSNNKKIQGL